MDRVCRVCGAVLVKKPGPGRWPSTCEDHRGKRPRLELSAEERRERAVRAARKRREAWQSPEMKAKAAERARAAASARWGKHVRCARNCGHPAAPSPSGAMPRWCSDCADDPLACKWEGCDAIVGTRGDRGANPKWCAQHARERRRLVPKDNLALKCGDSDCERPVRARGLCSMHWKRERHAEIGYKPQPFDGDRMRRHYERRTWQKSGERVTIAGLRQRDGDVCGICGEPIDFTLSGRHPMGRSVDHVLPRAKGGAHTWANCQLAHLRCNLSKGARVLDSVVA